MTAFPSVAAAASFAAIRRAIRAFLIIRASLVTRINCEGDCSGIGVLLWQELTDPTGQSGWANSHLPRRYARGCACPIGVWTVRGVPIKVFGSEINCPESAPFDGRGGDQLRQVPARQR